MVEKGITGEKCQSIYRYAKANSKCIKDYDKNKESSYLQYWDVTNLYGWPILRKFPVNNFGQIEYTSQFNKDFIKHNIEESDKEFFLEVDFHYIEKLYELYNNLLFSPEIMKIRKVKKLVANFHDKTGYVTHIRDLKKD